MRYFFLLGVIIIICFLSIYYYSGNSLPVITLNASNEPTKVKASAQAPQSTSNEDNLIYEALSGSRNKIKFGLKNKLANDETPLIIKADENIDDIFENVFNPQGSDTGSSDRNFYDIDNALQLIKINEKNNNFQFLKTQKERFFFAELDCFKTQTEAEKAWEVIKQKHIKLLKAAKMFVKHIKLSEDKYYYLLLTGPYDGFSKTNALCKKLTAAGQSCLVHPNQSTDLILSE